MKNAFSIYLILFSFLFFSSNSIFAQQESADKDKEAINKTILNYIEGWYEGNAERMAEALHPELTKKGVQTLPQTGGTLLSYASTTNMVEYTKAGFGKLPAEERGIKVEILDVYNEIATAKAVSAKFIDYIHLVKYNGQWKILNVIWEKNQ